MTDWIDVWARHAAAHAEGDRNVQAMRTNRGVPADGQYMRRLARYVAGLLDLSESDTLLDLCAGNGVLTEELVRYCESAVAVDFVPEMLARATHPSVRAVCADVREYEIPEGTVDKALVYAGVQYLDLGDTARLLSKVGRGLKPDGRALIADVPDADRMWDFYDNEERRARYFARLVDGHPLIGTWYAPAWFLALADTLGLQAKIHRQPHWQIYSSFRFDVTYRKPPGGRDG